MNEDIREIQMELGRQAQLINILHARITRLEVELDMVEIPKEWDITPERIVKMMEETGDDYKTCRDQLIHNYGI